MSSLLAWSTACNTTAPSADSPPVASTPPPSVPSAPARAALSAARMAADKHLTIVSAEGTTPAGDDDLPLITVSKSELLVGADVIAPVIPGPLGFDAAIKQQGKRAALHVLPLDAALRPLRASSTQSTARILLDASTSYRSALEVFYSTAQAGFTSFDLIVTGASGLRALPASTPSLAEHRASKAPGATPAASFVLEATGVTISVGDVPVGTGCVKGGRGAAVAATGGKVDLAALRACTIALAKLSPGWEHLTIANVSAAGELDMQSVLVAIAAIVPLLPVIHFGLLSS